MKPFFTATLVPIVRFTKKISCQAMAFRGAICIGVDRAGAMVPLRAAGQGARQFAQWALQQGCEVCLLLDEQRPVSVAHIFEAVCRFVETGTYEQLIIYFSGHGILTAPGTEYWLLSGAPHNPNEAVNLFRAVEDARDAGIPHVVFVSDACRSAATGPLLNGITGGTIFPNRGLRAQRGELDVFYATRPGDPAWEVPGAEAAADYQGLFTTCLLRTLHRPPRALVEMLTEATVAHPVLTARRLKPYLERQVPLAAGAVDVRLRQCPEIRVETMLPKYLATVAAVAEEGVTPTGSAQLPISEHHPLQRVEARLPREASEARNWIRRLIEASRHAQAETGTGFLVVGTRLATARAPGWTIRSTTHQGATQTRLLLARPGSTEPGVALLQFAEGTGALLAIVPGFIGTVVVEGGRVVSVNYVPANDQAGSPLNLPQPELEYLKAGVAEEARRGGFEPWAYTHDISYLSGTDPTLALYAAYGYAQAGASQEVTRLYNALHDAFPHQSFFDLALLATRYLPTHSDVALRTLQPAAPMLAQGWAVLTPEHPLHRGWHEQLRPLLLPALWTTYSDRGVSLLDTLLSTPTFR